jgi:hypothetical protein
MPELLLAEDCTGGRWMGEDEENVHHRGTESTEKTENQGWAFSVSLAPVFPKSPRGNKEKTGQTAEVFSLFPLEL